MFNVREDLILDLTGVDAGPLLEHWRWLVDATYTPLFASALGDVFFRGQDGAYYWMDVGSGDLTRVAADAAEFERRLNGADEMGYLLTADLVDQLRAAGQVLAPGEVYSYQMIPVLGGELEPDNFRVTDLATHLATWGPVLERVKDLPDGTEVTFEVVE